MWSIIAILALGLGISLAVTPRVRDLALAHGVIDQANSSRKVHARAVPRLGGIAIVAGTFGAIGLAVLLFDGPRPVIGAWSHLVVLCASAAAVAALGLYDDLCGANAREKLCVQFGAALVLYAAGFRIDFVENPFGGVIDVQAISLPLTLLWIAGVSNAINLIDGLDGLAGGLTLAGLLVVLVISVRTGDTPGAIVAAAAAGAVLGFLVYNVNPASVFMGDTGSLFLGMLLAVITLRPHGGARHSVPLLALIVTLAIPIGDTLLAILRRWLRGAPIFSADKEHLHHRLLRAGLSHRCTVEVLWCASGLLGATALDITSRHQLPELLVGACAVTGALALVRLHMIPLPGAELVVQRRRNRARRRTIRALAQQLRAAATAEEAEKTLKAYAGALGAREITLAHPSPVPRAPLRAVPRADTGAHFVLSQGDPAWAAIDVTLAGTSAMDRDAEIAFETVAARTAEALHRVEARAHHS